MKRTRRTCHIKEPADENARVRADCLVVDGNKVSNCGEAYEQYKRNTSPSWEQHVGVQTTEFADHSFGLQTVVGLVRFGVEQ